MFKFITHRPLWLNILVGLILAMLIFCLFVLSLNWLTNHNESKTVPSVLGKNFNDAKKALEKAGFEVMIQDSIYTDTTGPLVVLKQVPEGDDVVKVNRTVYLTINRSMPPMVEMPNILGYSLRSAEMVLKNAGLKLGDTIFKPDFAKNAVLEQRYNGAGIAAGAQVRMGSRIDLVLGDGVSDKQFVVPNLVGMTYCQAKDLLEQNGLGFASIIATGISDTCNAFIFRQNPERYDEDKKFRYIRSGQTMDVWLQTDKPVTDSTAPPPATEPE